MTVHFVLKDDHDEIVGSIDDNGLLPAAGDMMWLNKELGPANKRYRATGRTIHWEILRGIATVFVEVEPWT